MAKQRSQHNKCRDKPYQPPRTTSARAGMLAPSWAQLLLGRTQFPAGSQTLFDLSKALVVTQPVPLLNGRS